TAAPIAAAAALLASQAAAAGPHGHPTHATGRAVFVQTNDLHGNQIIAFDRAGDGSLTQAGVFDTGGVGARAAGAVADSLASQGQIGFTPDGSKLIVTTKASGSAIDVFGVGADGTLSASPVVSPSATPVPFAFTFDPSGRLVVGEAGASSVSTYSIEGDGTLSGAKSASDGQTALCWIVPAQGTYFVANTGSNTLSSFRVGADGQPTLLSAVASTTEAGPIDLAATPAPACVWLTWPGLIAELMTCG